jgi:hypothetical protein
MKPLGELGRMTKRVEMLEKRLGELEEMLLANNGRPADFSVLLHEMLTRHLAQGAPNVTQ